MFNHKIALSFLTLSIIILSACGSDGGDRNFIGSAEISLNVSPDQIDTADRSEVTIDISEASDTGIVLKIFYSNSLEYVPGSAFIQADGVKSSISPAFNESTDSDEIYLVFFLSKDDFDQSSDGKVIFQLVGVTELINGEIEVDSDVDDPLIDNTSEFDPEEPNFAAEASASIEVKA